MSAKNRTITTEFILVGFSTDPLLNIFLFVLFLAIYSITISGNCLITLLIMITPQLHRPMYYFLCILAFLDFCTSTSVVPRLLYNLLSTRRTISYMACAIQFYTVIYVVGTECFLLAIMAYDRYVAICLPLHYLVLMRWRTCHCLTALVWVITFILIVFPALLMPLDLCYPNQINHFMCEGLAIMQLACDDIFLNKIMVSVTCFAVIFLPFVAIIASYSCIIFSILKIPSTGRSKTFSTCTSHITVVFLAYGSGMITYFSPSSQYSIKQAKYLSLFSLSVFPAINPLIYTLNNKDAKDSMRKVSLNVSISV